MEVVNLDLDVKEVLDKHGELLDKHTDDINELQIFKSVTEEKFNNFGAQLTRVENTLLTSNNAILQTLNNVVSNRDQNKTQVVLKVLGIIGGIISTLTIIYFASKGINSNVPTF